MPFSHRTLRYVALILVVALGAAIAAVSSRPADASRYVQVGIFDDAQILYGNPDVVFPQLKALNVQVIRATLYWGGPGGVAQDQPARPTNPADPAYNCATYDRTAFYAAAYGMKVIYTIYGTPAWANGGLEPNVAPTKPADLQSFARAAARRYDGTYAAGGRTIPAVRYWTAWVEPNNPNFLTPQWERVGATWQIRSGRDYAHICNAVTSGVHKIKRNKGKVACGVTAPRGNNNPRSSRPSVAPLAFLAAMKKAGARGFDAYAHHPYYGASWETPSTPPPQGTRGQPTTAVTLGNFPTFQRALRAAYGNVRIWFTEYGYQTNPPDVAFGVSKAKQAAYLREAFGKAQANKSVDMFVWFLMRDEQLLEGWQSGLLTSAGTKKPAYKVFQELRS